MTIDVNPALALKQSLAMTEELALAIDILAMNSIDVDRLIEEELCTNPALLEVEGVGDDGERFMAKGLSYERALKAARSPIDFRGHLLDQVRLCRFNAMEKRIAHLIIESLDDDGLLNDHAEVFELIGDETGAFPDWCELVRLRIMDLDPLGCAARDIAESLTHQARRQCLFEHHEFLRLLETIGTRKRPSYEELSIIKRDLHLGEIRRLNPRPALAFSERSAWPADAITPDVILRSSDGDTGMILSRRPSMRLAVRRDVFLERLRPKELSMLKAAYRRAMFFIRSLRFREGSLLAVSRIIAAWQMGWFFGDRSLRPLTMRDVALLAGLHESSISRLVRQKYIFCERGVFELRHFFSPGRRGLEGDLELSSAAVRDRLRRLIAEEDRQAPWPDAVLMEKLACEGVRISRRTVAKHRERLRIPAARDRQAVFARGSLA